MATRKFPAEFMRNVVWGDAEGAEVIGDTIIGMGRWSIHHRAVFEYEGKTYATTYRVGATECQDERPFEGVDEVEVVEVRPVERVVIDYVVVSDPPKKVAKPCDPNYVEEFDEDDEA